MAELISIIKNFDEAVNKAAEFYELGEVFVYPTDTIYGIGGNPFYSSVREKINLLKGREEGKKFILLAPSVNVLKSFVSFDDKIHEDFLNEIWPERISVVLNLKEKISKELDSLTGAFRIPDHQFCRKLLEKIRLPLISTSVNKSGSPSLNDPIEISNNFGNDIKAIFYEENLSLGKASTLIDLTQEKPKLLREGSVSFSYLEKKYNELKV